MDDGLVDARRHTLVSSESELLLGMGSNAEAVTATAFVILPADVGRTTMSTVAVAPLFTDPSVAAFERMKRDFNVTWLVADSTSTPVSPRITEFATPRFHAGTVTIYEVK